MWQINTIIFKPLVPTQKTNPWPWYDLLTDTENPSAPRKKAPLRHLPPPSPATQSPPTPQPAQSPVGSASPLADVLSDTQTLSLRLFLFIKLQMLRIRGPSGIVRLELPPTATANDLFQAVCSWTEPTEPVALQWLQLKTQHCHITQCPAPLSHFPSRTSYNPQPQLSSTST